MSYEILKKHRQVWERKKILQHLYIGWYKLILNNMNGHGPALEIGGGGGNFKEFFPDLISSDYTFCPWLDLNLDAHALPFQTNSLADIVVIDVLHHLARPALFIEEAQRVLRQNGRLIMLEPCISPVSFLIYNYLHQEDVDFSVDVLSKEMQWTKERKNPFEGNMAIPSRMFVREPDRFREQFPDFKIIRTTLSDFFVYPLSGGFEHPSLIPLSALSFLQFCEKLLMPLGAFFAFRMLIVLENKRNEQ